jgi:hypothetical protein
MDRRSPTCGSPKHRTPQGPTSTRLALGGPGWSSQPGPAGGIGQRVAAETRIAFDRPQQTIAIWRVTSQRMPLSGQGWRPALATHRARRSSRPPGWERLQTSGGRAGLSSARRLFVGDGQARRKSSKMRCGHAFEGATGSRAAGDESLCRAWTSGNDGGCSLWRKIVWVFTILHKSLCEQSLWPKWLRRRGRRGRRDRCDECRSTASTHGRYERLLEKSRER